MYQVYVYRANGEVENYQQDKKPSYDEIKKAVGGIIQQVPHLTQCAGLKRGQAYVHEEGRLLKMPLNRAATQIWLNNLGKGPFIYRPELFGDMIYFAKIPKNN